MRAAVLNAYNEPLVIEDLSAPNLGPHDVREIRIRLAWQVERRHQRLQRGADFARYRRRLPDRVVGHEVDRREALVDVVARRARTDDAG